ncbi:DUF3159 domain-containing protein [Cellulomonas bogoriensis]|uniref:Potassium ABC transporter n=1 Tax=Cellulomonas bogoriensis 69B4 = DSM 16987 TaxID=1386082 RepID=A0A0A0C295_9CELL|nr:DUF3159 domain-containing protein [Cellulomonas bogoriensis]KGM14285.1 potassium ABC transporter [Cellulomonas bogoriensis 69B4 = DSM 16987]
MADRDETTPGPADEAPQGAEPTGPGTEEDPDATATSRRGVQVLAGEEFSFAEAIGGVRGLVESAAPAVVFITVFVLWRELTPALVAAAALALVAVVVRLVQRTPATQAFSGVIGIAIAVVWAWNTGEAADFFAWGLWVNVAWGIGATVSVLVGWPVVGVLVSLLRGEDMSWRRDPAARGLRRRYAWATWLWVGVFGARLAVQVPLYLQGADAVGWLGTARLLMGVPLFAVGLWLTWLLVASPAARGARPGPPPSPPR